MAVFAEYLASIKNEQHRNSIRELLEQITKKYPDLVPKVAWNQPMFTYHDTYILGFSVSKQHLAVAPEAAGITRFTAEILKAGYEYTANLIRIKWAQSIDFSLLEKIIEFNISDKTNCSTFWRK